MTLGEKIRYSRKRCGLSQEQLAERMCVSRSAIAKWETDKGLPDIENIKILSKLLGISVDHLLDDSTGTDHFVIREACSLSAYGRGCKKIKKDRMMLERFPEANICTLLGRPILSDECSVTDSTRGILIPLPFGEPAFMKSVKELNMDFYLAERQTDLFFVTVTDSFLEIRMLNQAVPGNSFQLGDWVFIRGEYLTNP